MAIRMNLQHTERVLFCGSKWWGDPDMPENMQYPTMEVTEDGETFDYPLTFICQINCEDIAGFDKENKLPHEGMLYFFAAIDKWLGYESPFGNGKGEWKKGEVVVKYAKSVNFETFQTIMLVDDDDQALTDKELEIIFSECDDSEDCIRILGNATDPEVAETYPEHLSLLHLVSDQTSRLDFSGATLDIMMKEADLGYGNWKKIKANLSASPLK